MLILLLSLLLLTLLSLSLSLLLCVYLSMSHQEKSTFLSHFPSSFLFFVDVPLSIFLCSPSFTGRPHTVLSLPPCPVPSPPLPSLGARRHPTCHIFCPPPPPPPPLILLFTCSRPCCQSVDLDKFALIHNLVCIHFLNRSALLRKYYKREKARQHRVYKNNMGCSPCHLGISNF